MCGDVVSVKDARTAEKEEAEMRAAVEEDDESRELLAVTRRLNPADGREAVYCGRYWEVEGR